MSWYEDMLLLVSRREKYIESARVKLHVLFRLMKEEEHG
jgi:hypothetical protein